MAFPISQFNSGTGSDGLTSGTLPLAAVTGTGAAHTNGSSSTTITLTNTPDLTNVPDDGTGVVRLVTASGRQFNRILGRDNTLKTLLVEDAVNIPLGSPVDYGIGGKRATFDAAASRILIQTDVKAGWTLETETDQTITSGFTVTANGNLTDGFISVRGSSGHKILLQTANTFHYSVNLTYWRFSQLNWQNSNGTKTSANGITSSSSGVFQFDDCIFGDQTNTMRAGVIRNANTPKLIFTNCEFKYCTVFGLDALAATAFISNCRFHHNAIGARISFLTNGPSFVTDSIFDHNTGEGLIVATSGGAATSICAVENCVMDANGSHGIDLLTLWDQIIIRSNQITNNGGYGLRTPSGQDKFQYLIDWNNYYQNTSGPRLNINAGPNDLALDPQYRDAAGGNYTAGPGFRGTGSPGAGALVGINSNTRIYNDIGLPQNPRDGIGARNYFHGMGVIGG